MNERRSKEREEQTKRTRDLLVLATGPPDVSQGDEFPLRCVILCLLGVHPYQAVFGFSGKKHSNKIQLKLVLNEYLPQ